MNKLLEICGDGYSIGIKGDIDGRVSAYRTRVTGSSLVRYSFSDASADVKVWDDDAKELKPVANESEDTFEAESLPVFFETYYHVRLTVEKNAVRDVRVVHPLKSVAHAFDYEDGVLSGTIDFVNSPGKFRLPFEIKMRSGAVRLLILDVMVVSTKLDVLSDYSKILGRIESERKNLVYAFLSKTLGRAGLVGTDENTSQSQQYGIFNDMFAKLKSACEKVIYAPHTKSVRHVVYKRADAIKYWTVPQAREYGECNEEMRTRKYFRSEEQVRETDTIENQFVLHTLRVLCKLLSNVQERIKSSDSASEGFGEHVAMQKKAMERLARNPFFSRVGEFHGFRSSSLVLQKRSGYARIYAIYLAMKKALSVAGDDIDLGYRSIASLYEFWCFLMVRDAIVKITHINGIDEVRVEKVDELLNDALDQKLTKMTSVFDGEDCEIILSYQKTYGEKASEDDTFVLLNDQRPDIVMSVRDKTSGNVFTYLFDAKYRISAKNGKDMSPREAIDDMHRYRDAILYRAQKDGVRSHEVIGAYVLFPGRPFPHSYDYEPAIRDENIGAIPLLPGDNGEKALSVFVGKILEKKTIAKHLECAIAPRGAAISLESDQNVLVVRQEWNARIIDSRKGGAISIDKELGGDGVLPLPIDYVFVIEDGMGIELYRVKKTTVESRKKIQYHLELQHKYEDQNPIDENVLHNGQLTSRNRVDELMR